MLFRSLLVNKNANTFRMIESPLSFTYVQTGTRELPLGTTSLDELSTLWFSANIGFGLQKEISESITLFGEAQYQRVLNSILSQVGRDDVWNFSSLRVNIGIRNTF